MLHATCTQGNRGDSWFLMVKSQIVNLTFGPSFDHNLCFRCSNGSCEPISDIYIPRAFQWYIKCFNPISFDPCNRSLKIWESIGTPTPKVGAHLGVWRFIHSLTLFHTPRNMRCDSRASLLAYTLTSPCLGREPKSRVAIVFVFGYDIV
jgi:hypothetical protein